MAEPDRHPGEPQEPGRLPLRRRPGQLIACGWCGQQIALARVGRTPKWCSDTCRHRAWEAARAAAAGVLAVRVVDRTVEVEVPVPVVERVEVPVARSGAAWAPVLLQLARQIDAGRVYDRDLPALGDALGEVLRSLARRGPAGRR